MYSHTSSKPRYLTHEIPASAHQGRQVRPHAMQSRLLLPRDGPTQCLLRSGWGHPVKRERGARCNRCNSMTAPATVSGECDRLYATGGIQTSGKARFTQRPASQETCRSDHPTPARGAHGLRFSVCGGDLSPFAEGAPFPMTFSIHDPWTAHRAGPNWKESQ